MATFLRRQLQKLGRKDETPSTLTVNRPEGGNVTLSRPELQRYGLLHTMLDSDCDGEIGGLEGASFLRRCGLEDNSLREIWRLASGGTSKAKLTREDFFVACKLVAVAQARGEPTMTPLLANESLPLADFHYDITPDTTSLADLAHAVLSTSPADEFPRDAIRITIANPTTFGSTMDKHTKYLVSTITSLPHFPRKEVSVWRRFSDFEWLHKRLSLCFPAAVIPLFPAKRVVGNSDSAFITERMAALEAYVEKVAVHPALGTSLDFIVLLDASDPGLEAAKQYIEAVAADHAESILDKGFDAMSSLSGAITGNSAPSLVLKADEEFLAAVSAHANALSRLQALARTGDRVDGGATATIGAMTALGKAMLGLAEHERKNAGVVTTTATAVATAAASFARSGAAFAAPAPASLAAPAASSGASSADAAAAAAFSAHTAAAAASRSDTIAGMFAAADFSDPYSSLAAVAATSTAASGSSSSAGASKRLETSADMLIAAGQCLLDQSTMLRDQHKGYESTMLAALRSERDKEAELAEALRRREGTIERAQEANTTLLRKKKTLLGLRHTDKDYTAKITLAQQAVDKAETALTARKEELDKVTEVIKAELTRVMRSRRVELLARLAEYASDQATAARARAEPYGALTMALAGEGGGAVMERSREAVTAIARKAEAKARASAMASRASGAPAPGAAPAAGVPAAGAPVAAAAAGGASAVPVDVAPPALPDFAAPEGGGSMPTADEL